ncbi:unnamed protein product, partial [Larinioides sclopetarius]
MRSSDYYITPYEWKNAPDDKNPKQLVADPWIRPLESTKS